ncbi:glycosyl transferase family 2 [Streptomyces sp. BK022]|uniref:glycosyltransferase n=1 Tax=Streptomyces sp. BK022 TaxID=2512123 RepID=UPI00102A3509|nr:glycosyltransferase [Streptomyces sp. BK022]RZU46017.1 glycosyl transferase family 2 [Streptomyces sp. BK022]
MSVATLAVVVPAHDEERLLPVALAALARAARHPALAAVGVLTVVAADACRDRTEAVARDAGALVVRTDCRNPGRARAAGVRHALERSTARPSALWIATTDADSVVPPGWLAHQLARAREGWQAVVGTVALPLSSPLAAPHRALYEKTRPPKGTPWLHPHVHGANLGFAADAYLDAGGFPPLATGEDRALVHALERRGHRVLRTAACPVQTSPRLRPRAHGGFGHYLSAMARASDQPHGPSPVPGVGDPYDLGASGRADDVDA